jgi:hypothetical protein
MNRESNATSAPASGVTDPRGRPLVALLRALTVLPALITPALGSGKHISRYSPFMLHIPANGAEERSFSMRVPSDALFNRVNRSLDAERNGPGSP